MSYSKQDIINILVKRDGMDDYDAQRLVDEAQQEIDIIIEQGGDILEAEDVIEDLFGLEPDYLTTFLN